MRCALADFHHVWSELLVLPRLLATRLKGVERVRIFQDPVSADCHFIMLNVFCPTKETFVPNVLKRQRLYPRKKLFALSTLILFSDISLNPIASSQCRASPKE